MTVEAEAKYKNITNKELAAKAGFDPSNISKGKKDGSFPAVDTAVRIAQVLGVTVEFLVTGKSPSTNPNDSYYDISKFHKFSKTIEDLDRMDDHTRKSIISLINDLSPNHPK